LGTVVVTSAIDPRRESMRKLVFFLAVLALAAPAAGAGAERMTVVKSHGSDYGRVLFDGRGYVLYAFTRDPRRHSACSGTCARAWPPFIVHGKLAAARGARSALPGT